MAIVRRDQGSGVIVRFDDIAGHLVDIQVKGSRGRVVEIVVDENLRVRRHTREIAKLFADDVWDLRAAKIAYVEHDRAPILPRIEVRWHDPAKR